MDQSKAPDVSISDVLHLVSELRETALEFQEHIDVYFGAQTDWQRIRDRFVTFEERFVSLEARLSAFLPEPGWQEDELVFMMQELRSISQDFVDMRQEFLSALQESPDRVM